MPQTAFILALKRQEPQAFRQLLDTYQDLVVNTCFGFVARREEAEDLAQEVFIEVFRSVASFREEAQLKTWLYRIAVNKSLEYIRHQKRQKRFAWLSSLSGLTPDQEPASPMQHPDMSLEAQERARILYRCIDQLPQNQRIAFTLQKVEGLSYQEVAKVMDTSLSAVESLIHRARKSLRKKLEKTVRGE
jgi:RNA polymerase sigma-70 factor (family 1)